LSSEPTITRREAEFHLPTRKPDREPDRIAKQNDDDPFFQMTDTNQKKLGSTLWGIADQLRGAMGADVPGSIMCFRSDESKRTNFVASRK
jgi:hypothetical protein